MEKNNEGKEGMKKERTEVRMRDKKGIRQVTGKDGEDDADEFLHTMGHGDKVMLTLRPFAVDIGAERKGMDISHRGSAKKSAAKVTGAVFHHRGNGSGVITGLVGRGLTAGKSEKFVRGTEV